jgi:hypothetical protein
MEAVHCFEMLVNFYNATQCDIPEDNTLFNHCHENLKSDFAGLFPFQFCDYKSLLLSYCWKLAWMLFFMLHFVMLLYLLLCFPQWCVLFCSLAAPSLASDTISSLSLPSDYRSVSLGAVDDVSPETQDQSDGTSSAGAFGNMMFIDYPMIGLNKSKETCTHPVYFTWTSVSHWSSCVCVACCQNCVDLYGSLFY